MVKITEEKEYSIQDVLVKDNRGIYIYPKFVVAIKNYILKSNNRFNDIGEISEQYMMNFFGNHKWYEDDFEHGIYGAYKLESYSNSITENVDELQKQIDKIEDKIQKLVTKYQNAQKRYHGDSQLSKNIEGEIDALELEQRRLINLLNGKKKF